MAKVNYQYLKQFKDTPYYLNHEGRVFRKYKNGFTKIKGCTETDRGYTRTRIHIGDKKYNISRMMWETFMGEIPEGYCVAHKNKCTSMNDIGNLCLVKQNQTAKFRSQGKTLMKIVNLKSGKVYKGSRQAAKELKHSRYAIVSICNGAKLARTIIHVAWWDDVNDKPFRGNYQDYYEKYMREAW